MENKLEELPWDMIEEILSHVPPESLVRFRTVSKQWNALFNDKRFIHSHKATFRFILTTKSKIYAVSVNPKIELRELTLDVPGKKPRIPRYIIDCNEFLLCDMRKRAVVWNPWLRQTRRIDLENKHRGHFVAMGYDNGYKTLAAQRTKLEPTKTFWRTYDLSSDAWKDLFGEVTVGTRIGRIVTFHTTTRGCVSLNGTWYWVAYYVDEIKKLFFLVIFDFSTGKFHKFCDLPCEGIHHREDALIN